MRDPERLTRRAPNTTTGALMRAGLAERPSEASVRRTVKAVAASAGLGSATGGAAIAAETARGAAAGAAGWSAAPSAALSTKALLVKWLAIGAGGGVLVSFGAHQAVAPVPPTPAAVTQVSERAAPSAPPRARVPAANPSPPAPAPDARVASEVESESDASAPESARVPAAVRDRFTKGLATQGSVAELAAEIALVDRARASLSAGDAHAALVALQRYEAQCPSRQLYTEVLALRMEASHAVGNEADARSFAMRLLARGVARPLAERARRVIAE